MSDESKINEGSVVVLKSDARGYGASPTKMTVGQIFTQDSAKQCMCFWFVGHSLHEENIPAVALQEVESR